MCRHYCEASRHLVVEDRRFEIRSRYPMFTSPYVHAWTLDSMSSFLGEFSVSVSFVTEGPRAMKFRKIPLLAMIGLDYSTCSWDVLNVCRFLSNRDIVVLVVSFLVCQYVSDAVHLKHLGRTSLGSLNRIPSSMMYPSESSELF
ncbi:hypothetical protein CDAR_267301 [Caerostris darwini]|uniref:Uncharacterized protein n=1 Tax=Caerostris darwini TaxID=1538125 RepID=A0AAV4TLZ5_9ARAC|nr:hypothetical protein CDAR_267301 [Caerostris darwini]